MRVLMDADCLIKITQAGFKEPTLAAWSVSVPETVRREIVEARDRHAEAQTVEENLNRRRLGVIPGSVKDAGDDALVEAFNSGKFDFVATDDRRLIRRLTALGIACVVPGLILHYLVTEAKLSVSEGVRLLERLATRISSEQYQIVRFLMGGGQ